MPQLVYDNTLDIWPEIARERSYLAPVRVGMDRNTGKVLLGWDHVVQSIFTLFSTRYHERVIREWAGSFVPMMLGESIVSRVITRFYWAVASAIDHWEPNYSITRVRILSRGGQDYHDPDPAAELLTSPEEIRRGMVTFRMEGVYRPRGHLGDATPEERRSIGLVGHGYGRWETLQ
jgi:phage baseplate assembly protein W